MNNTNWGKVPDELTMEQFYKLCHVSKKTAKDVEALTGFRLGAQFMMDTFLSNEAPFESFLEG